MAPPFYFNGAEYFLIPFLFVFAIIFGALRLANIFKDNKKVDAVIALSLAFFTIFNTSMTELIWSNLGNVAIFFIFMFMIAFVMEIFGVRSNKANPQDKIVIIIAILFILLSISYLYTGMIPQLPFIGGGQNVLLLVFVSLILVIFWLAYKISSGGHAKG